MYYPVGWPKKLNFRLRSAPWSKLDNAGPVENGFSEHAARETGGGPGDPSGSGNAEEISEQIVQLAANTDRSLFVILTSRSVHIWCSKPTVEIVSHTRDESSIETLGHNVCVSWKPDSTMLVIKTSLDMLLFYKVAVKDSLEFVFEQTDVNVPGNKRESAELLAAGKIPSLYLFLSFSTKIAPGISSLLAAEEEVVVATKSGMVIGVNWDGTLDPGLSWQIATTSDLNIVDIKYSSMIGGFSLVFANGRVGFTPLHTVASSQETPLLQQGTPQQNYSSSRIQFVPDIDSGVTSAINHKYQIIVFGLRNADGVLCCIDEENSTVNVTHRLVLPSCKFPDVAASIGSITNLQWSPDSTVLACSWEKGGVALWSVFGALLMCSLAWDYGIDNQKAGHHILVSSLGWGKEGYQLWLIGQENGSSGQSNGKPGSGQKSLLQMSMAKSVLASNPSSVSCCEESLILVSEDRLYLGVGVSSESSQSSPPPPASGTNSKTKGRKGTTASSADDGDEVPSTNAQFSRMRWKQQPSEVGNHQWIIIQVPNSYLASNWPIRLAAIDSSGQHLAIAGRTGMAHYSLLSRKWKLFGNETQERDFEVCGGLLWWDNYVVLSCYNVVESRFEIRAYPHNTRLDNQFVRVAKVPAEVLVMSIYKDRLLTLLLDGTMLLFGFHKRRQSTPGATVSSVYQPTSLHLLQLNQVLVSNLVVPPECVTSILLTSLHYETKPSTEASESILMNVCGRLFFLEKEKTLQTPPAHRGPEDEDTGNSQALVYKAVSILASGVENVWVSQTDHKADRPHLTDALWISRGCHGMNVWLPLLPNGGSAERSFPMSNAHNFMSKRIMLPINTHIYPLAVLFRDAVVIGAENDTLDWGKSCPVSLPFSTISRTSQVYLHHILRELLKKNLGIHAWEIANSCSSLPYFPHSLELLLHETLEEEATSSTPIPDALLPRVIDFIREFPVFLETVVHCARKTELALWPHLFAVVGNPNVLFQACLDNGQLETAASYLLVLQNLERTSVSRKYATLLMDAAKKSSSKQLAADLSRFLQAIDPVDFENPPSKAPMAPSSSATHPHSMKCVVSPAMVTELDGHNVHQVKAGRKRTVSSTSALMLHSTTSNGSVPNSPDASTAARSHSLSHGVGIMKIDDGHSNSGSNINGGSGQLIPSPVVATVMSTTTKCNMANGLNNGLSKKADTMTTIPNPSKMVNGSYPTTETGDNDSQSASQCIIS